MAGPRNSPFTLVATLFIVAGGAILRAEAAGIVNRTDQTSHSAAHASGNMSIDQAVKMAEQRFKARVVRAESQHNGAQTVYVLRLLNESGRVWTVRVDASNGAVL